MGLTNAILTGEHGARRFGEASDWKTLMNSARANLPGIHIATFGYSGVQRSVGCVAAIVFHWVGLGSGWEGQAGLLSHSAGLIEIFGAG
jgi:hypothetical protein